MVKSEAQAGSTAAKQKVASASATSLAACSVKEHFLLDDEALHGLPVSCESGHLCMLLSRLFVSCYQLLHIAGGLLV